MSIASLLTAKYFLSGYVHDRLTRRKRAFAQLKRLGFQNVLHVCVFIKYRLQVVDIIRLIKDLEIMIPVIL